MPRRELKEPAQIEAWLSDWGERLVRPGQLTLIGSAALLWHAGQRGLKARLPENSMDVDVVTANAEVAALGYDAQGGSMFEMERGWHVHLRPELTLKEMPALWLDRVTRRKYGALLVLVPAPGDLIVAKLNRGEPRDVAHARWARGLGLC
jgi:hypothetical protein